MTMAGRELFGRTTAGWRRRRADIWPETEPTSSLAVPYERLSPRIAAVYEGKGSDRIRIRLSSTTSTAPDSRSSWFRAKISARARPWAKGECSRARHSTSDGARELDIVRRVEKSVSADTRTLSSLTASSRIVVSSTCATPRSRTWITSWPSPRSIAATVGDSALSTRSFTRCHRPRQLFGRYAGQLTLPQRVRSEAEGCLDVLGLQVRIRLQNICRGHPIRDHRDDRGYRDSQSADAWGSRHLLRPNGDAGHRLRQPTSRFSLAQTNTAGSMGRSQATVKDGRQRTPNLPKLGPWASLAKVPPPARCRSRTHPRRQCAPAPLKKAHRRFVATTAEMLRAGAGAPSLAGPDSFPVAWSAIGGVSRCRPVATTRDAR